MPRITKIYTRKGDDGTTALGGGQRVKKHIPRIEVYGTIDELSSQIGVARAHGLAPDLDAVLQTIQNELFHLGSDLCFLEEDKRRLSIPRIEGRHVEALEQALDRMTAELGPLENFILPGGAVGASQLHVARTVCRRAERHLVALAEQEPIAPESLRYLNRLSDALFVMARWENRHRSIADVTWDSRA